MKTLIIPLACSAVMVQAANHTPEKGTNQPNILIAISDDQSHIHTSMAGCTFVKTPAFDEIARTGIWFTNCFAGSPGCAPSRSSLVTGRHHWQNESSGQHASGWLKKYVPMVDAFRENGYHTGFTGKGVDPFEYGGSYREENAAGKAYNSVSYTKGPDDPRPAGGIAGSNYFENFRLFMNERKPGQPFFFWYGGHEPHRDYEESSGLKNGKKLSDVAVPGFLPDSKEVRSDLLDYAVEIEWFDSHLKKIIEYLKETGEFENTVIIVTGDNGMSWPRAKANCYEYGFHVPLAISYPHGFPGGRKVDDVVGFADFAPTLFELTGTPHDIMQPLSGKSFLKILKSEKQGIVDPSKKYVFSGRERHSSSRYNNLGYPQRSVRSRDFLYIWNMRSDLWPAGDPQMIKSTRPYELYPMYGIGSDGKHLPMKAFCDVDDGPSKRQMIEKYNDSYFKPFFDLAFNFRPEEELFDVVNDPFCLKNLAADAKFSKQKQELKEVLLNELKRTDDPRVTGPDKEIFETYERFSPMREFPKPK